jgi:hypothetical protein
MLALAAIFLAAFVAVFRGGFPYPSVPLAIFIPVASLPPAVLCFRYGIGVLKRKSDAHCPEPHEKVEGAGFQPEGPPNDRFTAGDLISRERDAAAGDGSSQFRQEAATERQGENAGFKSPEPPSDIPAASKNAVEPLKTCPKCGTPPLSQSAQACRFCGAKLP